MLKDMDFSHLQEIYLTNIFTFIGYRTRFFKICFQKRSIDDVVAKSYRKNIVKTKPTEEIITPPEKREILIK